MCEGTESIPVTPVLLNEGLAEHRFIVSRVIEKLIFAMALRTLVLEGAIGGRLAKLSPIMEIQTSSVAAARVEEGALAYRVGLLVLAWVDLKCREVEVFAHGGERKGLMERSDWRRFGVLSAEH